MNKTLPPDWIAAHCGPETLRIWAMRDGRACAEASCPAPSLPLQGPGLDAALGELSATWSISSDTPILACGHLDIDCRKVPCLPIDGALQPLAGSEFKALQAVPGLCQITPPDLMRGEEVMIAGFLSLNRDWDGVICLPGAHARWVQVSAGEVVSFLSFLSGELAALLGQSPALSTALQGDGWDQPAFDAALAETLSRPERLAAQLFSIHAEAALDGFNPPRARARLSALLIGAELAAAKPYWLGQNLAILSTAEVAGQYRTALATQGVPATLADPDRMLLQGLLMAHRLDRKG